MSNKEMYEAKQRYADRLHRDNERIGTMNGLTEKQ